MTTKTKILLLATLFFYGCELIQIGTTKKVKVIDANQKSAVGAVYLFKTELDSNNITGAMRLLASPTGRFYLAVEKLELYEDLARFRNVIADKSITNVYSDTLSADEYALDVELNNTKNVRFKTARINNQWYITEFK